MSVTTDVQQIVPESQSYNDISLTEKAREHLTKLLAERNIPDHGLRVFVSGGGCSGMQHSLTFADKKEERDTEVAPSFFIDPVALAYMDGATVHYDNTGMSPTFVFNDVFKEQGGTGMCGGCGGATGPGYGH